jgi:hypothetical protein
MKVEVSVRGRGKKKGRRHVEGYYTRRKGILRFYAYDNSSKGKRINSRQPIPLKKKKRLKY